MKIFNRKKWKKAMEETQKIEYKCKSCKDRGYWYPNNLMLPSIPCPHCNINGEIY